jgi:hypothetical protein
MYLSLSIYGILHSLFPISASVYGIQTSASVGMVSWKPKVQHPENTSYATKNLKQKVTSAGQMENAAMQSPDLGPDRQSDGLPHLCVTCQLPICDRRHRFAIHYFAPCSVLPKAKFQCYVWRMAGTSVHPRSHMVTPVGRKF